jgi:hypothetical protein
MARVVEHFFKLFVYSHVHTLVFWGILFYFLLIYSHVNTLFGSFLTLPPPPPSAPITPSVPARSCSGFITNFVEEKT